MFHTKWKSDITFIFVSSLLISSFRNVVLTNNLLLNCSQVLLYCLQSFLINEYAWAQWCNLMEYTCALLFCINHCSLYAMTANSSTWSQSWQHCRCTLDGSDFLFPALNIQVIYTNETYINVVQKYFIA